MKPRATFDTPALLVRPRGALALSAIMYVAAALHTVLLGRLGWPSSEVLWFAMLIPTIILSFYYGRWGALASVLGAAALFVVIELNVHDAAFGSERTLFGAAVLIAIVSLAVAIGELAELLRREYRGRVRAERSAATSELATALRHEIYNPLTALVAEIELLQDDVGSLTPAARESVSSLGGMAARISELVERVVQLESPKRVEYLEGRWMTDLSEG